MSEKQKNIDAVPIKVEVLKQGNIIQKLAGKYMPLIILSSAVISSFWNADGKGATFLITAIMVSVVFSGMASLAAKKDTKVKATPLYCSIGMFSSSKFLTNDTQSILMGYTMGYVMSCLVSVWDSVVISKKITITILVVASSLFNLFIRANIMGMIKGDINHCISWKRWLSTFALGVVGGACVIVLLNVVFKTSIKQHMLYNFGAGDGKKSDKSPYYYCTDQNAN